MQDSLTVGKRGVKVTCVPKGVGNTTDEPEPE